MTTYQPSCYCGTPMSLVRNKNWKSAPKFITNGAVWIAVRCGHGLGYNPDIDVIVKG